MVELLLKFMDTATKKDDTVETLARIEGLNVVMYEDCKQANKVLAEEKAAADRTTC